MVVASRQNFWFSVTRRARPHAELRAPTPVPSRISNLVLVALLFIVGFYWARYIGANAGVVMLLSGLALVGVALALGG